MEKVNDIRKRFEAIIESDAKAYADLVVDNRALNEWVPEAVSTNQYMPEYLTEKYEKKLQDLTQRYQARATEENRQLQQLAAEIKEKYISPLIRSEKKDPDYAVKINNAIQFLSAEGENITDTVARNILADFIFDYETMRRFEKLISTQTGKAAIDPRGNTRFPETFGHMQKVDEVMKKYIEIEEITAALFKRELKSFPDYANSTGGINCQSVNPVRLIEDTQKNRLLEMAGEIEPMINRIGEMKRDDIGGLAAESRFSHTEV